MWETKVKRWEKKKGERKKTTRTRAMLQDEVAKATMQGGGRTLFALTQRVLYCSASASA